MNPVDLLNNFGRRLSAAFVAPARTAVSSDDARTADSPSAAAGGFSKPEHIVVPVSPRPRYVVGDERWDCEALIAGRIKAGLR